MWDDIKIVVLLLIKLWFENQFYTQIVYKYREYTEKYQIII